MTIDVLPWWVTEAPSHVSAAHTQAEQYQSIDEIKAFNADLAHLRLGLAEERAATEAESLEANQFIDQQLANPVVKSYLNAEAERGHDFDKLSLQAKQELLRALPEMDDYIRWNDKYNALFGPLHKLREEQRSKTSTAPQVPLQKLEMPKAEAPELDIEQSFKEVLKVILANIDTALESAGQAPANRPASERRQPTISSAAMMEAARAAYPKLSPNEACLRLLGECLEGLEKRARARDFGPTNTLDPIEINPEKLKKGLGIVATVATLATSPAFLNGAEGSRGSSQVASISAIADENKKLSQTLGSIQEVDKQPSLATERPAAKPAVDFYHEAAGLKINNFLVGQTPAIKKAIEAQEDIIKIVIDHPEAAAIVSEQGVAVPRNAAQELELETYLQLQYVENDDTFTDEQKLVIFGLLVRAHSLAVAEDTQMEIETTPVAPPAVTEQGVVPPSEVKPPAEAPAPEAAVPEAVKPAETKPQSTAPKPAETTAPEKSLKLEIANQKSDILSQEQLEKIQENLPVYLEVAKEKNIPWALLAVAHFRERNSARNNPGNKQGIYQFVDEHGGPYPEGPVSHEEFVRQTNLVADFLKAKAKNHNNEGLQNLTANSDPETIKDTLFSYNGRSPKYMHQAHRLGFKFGRDGSPYVVNKIDDLRDPNKNPKGWGQVKKDFGPIVFAANQDPGAFVVYRELMRLAGTPIAEANGVRLSASEIEMLKMKDGREIAKHLKDKHEGVSGKLDTSEIEKLGKAWGDHKLHPAAAEQFRLLNDAYKAEFGENIVLEDSYRSYEEQVQVKKKLPKLAARPGESQHGWGLALDMNGGVQVEGNKKHEWLEKNAHKYGFVNPKWAHNDDGRQEEPWHWEFRGSAATFAETNSYNG